MLYYVYNRSPSLPASVAVNDLEIQDIVDELFERPAGSGGVSAEAILDEVMAHSPAVGEPHAEGDMMVGEVEEDEEDSIDGSLTDSELGEAGDDNCNSAGEEV